MFLMTDPARAEVATGHPEMPFRDIVDAYKRAVYYLAVDLTGNHHDAEDLSQDVFIKAYRNLASFRGEAEMYTWLRRITVNTYLNSKRKKSLAFFRVFGQDEDPDRTPTEDVGPDAPVEASIVRGHIERALDSLSPRERAAFVLRHYDDLTVKEVAAAMEVASGTVKSLLFRATQKLQTQLVSLHEERE